MSFLSSLFHSGPGVRSVAPVEASQLVKEGKAVLVDVREPDEWAETGVADCALLIPMRDLSGEAGRKLVEENKDKEFLFYCLSGNRSGSVARAFSQRGLRVGNVGGFPGWVAAGLPVRKV